MSKNHLPSKTYTSFLHQDDMERFNLETMGRVLGTIRNDDYCYLVKSLNNGEKITKNSRRKRLMDKYLISSREAGSIVFSNTDQLALVKRTTEENIKDWEKDIKKYTKSFNDCKGQKSPHKRRYYASLIQQTQSKIKRAKKKYPSCCFGGRKLQKRITNYPWDSEARQDWENKRMFLSFMGNSGRNKGNDIIKYDADSGIFIAKISEGLQALCSFHSREIPIGSSLFKHGKVSIASSIEDKKAIFYSFVWSSHKRQWYVHTTVKMSQDDQRDNLKRRTQHSPVKKFDRVCGIDQNSGFIAATIIDRHGNPISKMILNHTHSKDVSSLVSTLVIWAINNGVSHFSIEKLKGLNCKRRKSNNCGAALNRVVSTIPFGEFRSRLTSTAETYGVKVVEVNPYHTSKNTIYWGEDIFGSTIHEKASCLIGRKLLGLSISRRNHKKQHPKKNSVSLRVFNAQNGSTLHNNHDNTSSQVCVVDCGS